MSAPAAAPEVRYKGVRMRKWGMWVAEVRLPNSRERIWLGSYKTAEKAARAYDAAVFCLRGPTAVFNFPESPSHIPNAGPGMTAAEIRAAAVRFAHDGRAASTAPEEPEAGARESGEHERREVDGNEQTQEVQSGAASTSQLGLSIGELPVELFSPEFWGGYDGSVDGDDGGDHMYRTSWLWNF